MSITTSKTQRRVEQYTKFEWITSAGKWDVKKYIGDGKIEKFG